MYEESSSSAEAALYYDGWLDTLHPSIAKDFRKKTAVPADWLPAVLAYFDHPFTTAFFEGANSVIKKMIANGPGTKYQTLRSQLMLDCQNGRGSEVEHRVTPLATNLGFDPACRAPGISARRRSVPPPRQSKRPR